MLNKKTIVSKQYSDHYLLDSVFETTLGQMHIGTLNILIRKALRLYQAEPGSEILVRTNCPIKWVLNSPSFTQIEKKLEHLGKKLMPIPKINLIHEHNKKQLELVDIQSNGPITVLPSVCKFYLEDKPTFHQRMLALGSLVGKTIQNSLLRTEFNLFAIQELQTDEITLSFFLQGLNANGRDYLSCYCKKNKTSYVPAIIYDTRQLELIDLNKNNHCYKRIES
ncbi:MAG: hypothetical protein K2Q14_00495, partial [Gammaproteobacteria bacterium]|nr:hypothetical protein [Gammaproteobacteria bacterium]